LAKSNLITPSELPSSLISNQDFSESVDPDHTLSLKKAFSHLEHNLIRKVLKLTGGNRSKAAKILEVSRPMLISKIKKYSLG
jgi:transcriptional regulator with PAS, ATPase and Fis domain